MKKLLSILGAMGLVATAGASVVACGETSVDNNPSVNYKTFDGWVQDSINNKSSEVIFVGGRTDSDSLSFLGAVESTINTTPSAYNTMISQDQMNKIDDAFNNTYLNKSNSSISTAATGAFSNLSAVATNDKIIEGNTGTVKSYLWNDNKNDGHPDNVKLHSILVDDASSFFKNGLGKDIVSKFLNEQVKATNSWYYNHENQIKVSDDEENRQIKDTQKGIASKLESAGNGPFFLLITNGKLVGVSQGFKNYKTYNSSMKSDTSLTGKTTYDLSSSQAKNDITVLFNKFSSSLLEPFASWLENNWVPKKSGDKNLVVSNKDSDATTGWDKSNQNEKVDPTKIGDNAKPSDSSDNNSNSNSDSSNTKSFAIDPAKYIN